MKLKFYFLFFLFFAVLFVMSFFLASHRFLLIPFIIMCVAAPGYLIWKFGYENKRKLKKLKDVGVRSVAIVCDIEDTGMMLNQTNIGIRLTLDVQPTTQPSFRTVVETFVSRVQIPRKGDRVEVLYNPENPSELAVVG